MLHDKIFKIKLSEHGFLDRLMYTRLTHPVIDYAKKKNYTPNHLTTCSFFFQGLGIAFLYYDYRWNYTFFYMIGYYFDNIDGPMARKYNMVTKFGDWYDHATDVSCFIATNYILIYEYNLLHNLLVVLFYLIQMSGLLFYTGCQEQIYNKYLKSESGKESEVSESLYLTTYLITDPEKLIRYLKPFCITNSLLFISLMPHFI